MIDDTILTALANSGSFRMDYDLSSNVKTNSSWTGTDIIWGTGVKDIDNIIGLMGVYPLGKFNLDTGVDGKDSSWNPATVDDMTRFRAIFVEMWGEVNKVSVWTDEWHS